MKKDLLITSGLCLLTFLLAILCSAVWGTSKKVGFVEIQGTISVANIILFPFTFLGMLTVWRWVNKWKPR